MSSKELHFFARPRRFFFHYSRPATQAAGETRMNVHVDGQCLSARRVDCKVPVETKENKVQPHLVLQGFARRVELLGDTIYIENS